MILGAIEDDHDWKSADTLIQQLVDCVSENGNYLLNVGPNGEGEIPAPSVERLRTVGKWMAVNGEAIYRRSPRSSAMNWAVRATQKDGRGNPLFVTAWKWRCTVKPAAAGSGQPDKVFIHFFQWPGESWTLAAMKGHVTKAYLLADAAKKPLKIQQDGTHLTVSDLPANATDPWIRCSAWRPNREREGGPQTNCVPFGWPRRVATIRR